MCRAVFRAQVGPASIRMLVVAIAVVGVTLSAQAPETLLRRSDVGGFVPAAFRARLLMQQENGPAASEIELWRSGADRTLVRFLDSKERGKYLVRRAADLWFIAPGAKQPVRLSPTHRVYGAATLDVLLGLHLSDDYRITGTLSQSTPGGGAFVVFDLQATSAQQQFASVRYTVQTATERPVSALYRLQSGREATLIEFFDWAGSGRTQRYAKRIQVRDLLRKGALTRVDVVEFEERAVPDGLFDLKDPSARRALEKGGEPHLPSAQSQSFLKQNH